MKSITFECEVITPMFLAGADGRTPELRAPSIKGAMRFWWRAVNGHLVKQNPDGSWDFSELKKREAKIFGGGGKIASRSRIEVLVQPKKLQFSYIKFPDKFKVNVRDTSLKINVLDYLAYGTYEYKRGEGNVYIKGRIKEKQKFKLIFHFNENYVNLTEDILKPLILTSRIGGLGAKVRNGFGKFYIQRAYLEDGKDVNLSYINEILNKIQNGLLPYTSLSKKYKVFHLVDSNGRSIKRENALEILYELGKIYKTAREQLENKSRYNKRIFLGSPLQVDKENKSFLERHAKSYFLSVSKSKNFYKGYIYFLPYYFLEGYKSISNINDLREKREKYFEIHEEFNELLLNSRKLKEL